jgi:hypothetical protein
MNLSARDFLLTQYMKLHRFAARPAAGTIPLCALGHRSYAPSPLFLGGAAAAAARGAWRQQPPAQIPPTTICAGALPSRLQPLACCCIVRY